MVDSILTYCSAVKNQNIGMIHLRRKITTEVLYWHEQLGERLVGMYIPESLLQYIRYFYQNFTFGNTIDAPIIRMGYKGYLQDQTSGVSKYELDVTAYKPILRSLVESYGITSSLKKWYRDNLGHGLRDHLPASDTVIYYDPQFCTFWHNCNIAYSQNGMVNYCRRVKSIDENWYYGEFAEETDGSIYASSSVSLYNEDNKITTSDGEYFPTISYSRQESGFWTPHSDFGAKTNNQDCSSICCYQIGMIRPLTLLSHKISSHLYSAPYYRNGVWIEQEGSAAGAQVVQQSSIRGLETPVSQTVLSLFD